MVRSYPIALAPLPQTPFRRTLAAMDRILPSELPYVIGFIAVVLAIFWLIGRAADRGLLSRSVRRAHPAYSIGSALIFGLGCIVFAFDGRWLGASLYGCAVVFFLIDAWRLFRRT